MIKKGFTLAEILVTLTIVGVVSAIVLPQFVTNAHNRANAAKLSSIISDYENVFAMMMLKENADDFFDTRFGSAYNKKNVENMRKELSAYTKVLRATSSLTDFGYVSSTPFYTISGGTPSGNMNLVAATSTPGGANLLFQEIPSGKSYSTLFIDVNGNGVPNKYGRDVFAFALNNEGRLYPFGSENAAETLGVSNPGSYTWQSDDATYGCTGTGYDGLGCTGKLVENNFKVDF